MEKNSLPDGWIKTELKNCIEILDSERVPVNAIERAKRKGIIPYYGAAGQVGWIDDYLFDDDLVLLGEDGAPFLDIFKDKAYLIYGKSWVNNHAHVLKGIQNLMVSKLLCFYLNQFNYRDYVTGTTRLKLNQTSMKKIPILVPPFREQERIVKKIDELFSNCDFIIKKLDKIQTQLKLYKQSLLKSAFSGDMTEKFRRENPSETIESLIKKIHELKKTQEKKLQKISLPEKEIGFHKIPNSWGWIHVGNVCTQLQYGTSKKSCNDSSQIPILGMGNIVDGKLVFKNLKFMSKNSEDINEFLLHNDDLLFNRTNSAELVGKTAIFKNTYPKSIFASYLIRAKINSKIFLPSLLSNYVNSLFGRLFIKSVVSQQVGQANVNGTKFSMMLFPLIPMKEQKILLKNIETSILSIDKISKEIESRLYSLRMMKLSILKQAFEGKLIPQDPNDEPASVTLEKIQLQRKNEKLKK